MKKNPATELRNATETTGRAFRKEAPDFDAFVAKWQAGLRGRGKEWEGTQAVAELKRRGVFDFLADGREEAHRQRSAHLRRKMFYEIELYRHDALRRLAKEHFDDVDGFLRSVGERIGKRAERVPLRYLKGLLIELQKHVFRAQGAARWFKFQKENLRFGFWEETVWPDVPRRRIVARKLELDTRLQIELGKALAFYLREKHVSLETVARLILLAYWAGGLSALNPSTNFPQSKYTGRLLKIRNIRENLREAKLHEAATYRRLQPERFLHELEQAKRSLGNAIPRNTRIGALSLLYISRATSRFGLTEKQIRHWIRTGRLTP
jgi:uncharacterized protein YeaO (DUF488 family)